MRMTAFPGVAALCLAAVLSGPALACGWWGDGEMNRDTDTAAAGSHEDTGAARIPAGLQAARVPGREGYGIAVFRPDLAVPYLRATEGRRIARIEELKALGFAAVIDLGTPVTAAMSHRAETEALSMRYMNIPAAGGTPTPDEVALFSATLAGSANRPLLVYAPEAQLLGDMWTQHRLAQGAPLGTALGEGLVFGISRELEQALAGR